MTTKGSTWVPRMLTLACGALAAFFVSQGIGCAISSSTDTAPTSTPSQSMSDSGIYGYLTAAWGNPPANPPSTQCVTVYDSAGIDLVARGTCSGMFGNFRVPLAPGRYVVELGGSWESRNGTMLFVPNRRTIEIGEDQWLKLAPPSPPGPVP
jgi:hypothetical protein